MDFDTFDTLIRQHPRPVILVEGTREVSPPDRPQLVAFGRWLARTYPHAIFRTGNAKGADEAFAEGVGEVDASRLEFVLPYPSHRKQKTAPDAKRVAFSQISPESEQQALGQTEQASPEYASLLAKRDRVPKLKAKADYLLRDTLKVSGADEVDLNQAVFGIFYVNSADPMKGGTGHTIRVCQTLGTPVAFQDQWMGWIED